MLQVGINGYGTIGKRVADAVAAQPDMTVAGVAKTRPNYEAELAVRNDYPLYAAVPERRERFDEAGVPVAGDVEELVADADVMVDATPSGIGAQNRDLYEAHDTPALFQGGEDADVADASFTARANYEDAVGADYVRVVSCNTTGLARLIAPLKEHYGVEAVTATLVRRGGDPGQTDRGPIDDILPDPTTIPSHHGPDVETVLEVDITTMGLKVPATLMHTHAVDVALAATPDDDAVRDLLADQSRVWTVPERFAMDGAGKLKDYAADVGRPRGDIWENALWAESVTVEDGHLYAFQAIHQESDVVPENVDALRAVTGLADREESVATTNEALGMGL
jgi:glyceraldehyde-3-phosphate dehydrogenase (NAD(P))